MERKINFTKENFARMSELAVEMLLENRVILSKIGTPLSIVELLHTTSINTLNEIKRILDNKIRKIEEGDEWVSMDKDKLDPYRKDRELVNLIVGYKRYTTEIAEHEAKKKELSKKLTELKESTKTPEDRIKELEAQLKELEEF